MIGKLSERVVMTLRAKSMMEEDDTELYLYGFFILLTHLFFFLFALVCGIFLDALWEAVLFYIVFSLIRAYAGGIHAKSETTCTLLTAIAIFSSVCIIRLLSEMPSKIVTGAMLLLGGISILICAPLDSPEKPLDAHIRNRYRFASVLILIAYMIAAAVAYVSGFYSAVYVIATSLFLEGILLIGGEVHVKA